MKMGLKLKLLCSNSKLRNLPRKKEILESNNNSHLSSTIHMSKHLTFQSTKVDPSPSEIDKNDCYQLPQMGETL